MEEMSFLLVLKNCEGFGYPDGVGKIIQPARNSDWKCPWEWFCGSLWWNHVPTAGFWRGCRLI